MLLEPIHESIHEGRIRFGGRLGPESLGVAFEFLDAPLHVAGLDYLLLYFKLDGVTGKVDYKFGESAPAVAKFDITQSIWTHKSVPFGTAMLITRMKVSIKDQVVLKAIMTFTVQDYGTGAKSALPDKK